MKIAIEVNQQVKRLTLFLATKESEKILNNNVEIIFNSRAHERLKNYFIDPNTNHHTSISYIYTVMKTLK